MNDWGSQLKRKLEADGKLPAPKKAPPRGTLAERVAKCEQAFDVARDPVFSATVLAAPRTKKNHGRRIRRGGRTLTIPSEAFEAFEREALRELELVVERPTDPIAYAVNARIVFYRDARRGDAVGYYQAIADVLQKARVVEDDKWIVSWDGSRLELDRKNPRLEIVLERVVS